MADLTSPATAPWLFDGESAPLNSSGSLVTLVNGRTFSLSGSGGDVAGPGPQGLFMLDTRYVSQLRLLIDGETVEPLGIDQRDAFSASFIGRHIGSAKAADTPIIVARTRRLNQGQQETIEIRNHGPVPVISLVTVMVSCDFANLFAVKEGRVPEDLEVLQVQRPDGLWFEPSDGRSIGLSVVSDIVPNLIETHRLCWTVTIPAGETWSTTIDFTPWRNGRPATTGSNELSSDPQDLLHAWNEKVPVIDSDHSSLNLCTSKALSDLASLRIFDPAFPNEPVIAAGAPWFMTLFGRDSLIAAWMALLVDPELAAGVVQTLARFQGEKVDPLTNEEPGKIMHEIRFADANSAALSEGDLYYGTADATPLFVMLLGELRRWGAADDVVDALLPNVDRALTWMTDYGDRDGDGYIEYVRSDATGLQNQGWKDSWDGIRYADGRVASAPIALCEVQAYAYSAYRSRARLAEDANDAATAVHWERKASALREAFNRDFWLEDRGWFAVGLDADKNPIDSMTSNVGHCLWAGIIDEDKAAIVADRLLAPDMFSGWGIRTMSSDTPGYNPTGYHVGSVWPHDSAIVAAGLMRYNLVEHAHRVMLGLLDAGARSEGRLPELMAGFGRDEFATPMAYPASCSPQAWAAAAPMLLLRWMLRLDPWYSKDRLWIDPKLPPGIKRLRVTGIPLGADQISVTVEGDEVEIEGVPKHITVVRGLRPGSPRDRWT